MKPTLQTNYKDDILNTSVEGMRRYQMIYNSDNTVSFKDVTPYDQTGSDFGAGDINLTNQAVNQSADAGKIIDDPDTAEATTEEGYIAGVQLFNHVTDSLGDISSFTNEEYSSLGAFLQYCIDNGYLPNVNIQTYYLYNNGVVNTDIIDSLINYGVAGTNGTTTQNANNISISAVGKSGSARRQGVYTPLINLTSAQKVTCTFTKSSGTTMYLVALTELADEGTDITNAVNVATSTATSGVIELDVSKLKGNYYIYAMLQTPQDTTTYNATITEMTITM